MRYAGLTEHQVLEHYFVVDFRACQIWPFCLLLLEKSLQDKAT